MPTATTRGCYGTKSIEDRKKRRKAYQQQQQQQLKQKKKKHSTTATTTTTPLYRPNIRGEGRRRREEEVTPVMSNTQPQEQIEIQKSSLFGERNKRSVKASSIDSSHHHQEEEEEGGGGENQPQIMNNSSSRRKMTRRKAAATSFKTSYFPDREKKKEKTKEQDEVKTKPKKKRNLSLSAASFEWDTMVEEENGGQKRILDDDDEDEEDAKEENFEEDASSHDNAPDDDDTISIQLEEGGEHEHNYEINTDESGGDDDEEEEHSDDNDSDEDFENESNMSSPLPTQEKQLQQKVQLARLRSSCTKFIDKASSPTPPAAAAPVGTKEKNAKTTTTTTTTTRRRRNKRRIVVTKSKLPPVPKVEDDDVVDGNGLSFVSSQTPPPTTTARKRGRRKQGEEDGENNDCVQKETKNQKIQKQRGQFRKRGDDRSKKMESEEEKDGANEEKKKKTAQQKKQKSYGETKMERKEKQKNSSADTDADGNDKDDGALPPSPPPPLKKQQKRVLKESTINESKQHNRSMLRSSRMKQLHSAVSIFESQLKCASNGVSSSSSTFKKQKQQQHQQQQKVAKKKGIKEYRKGDDVNDHEDEVTSDQQISKHEDKVTSSAAAAAVTDARSKKKRQLTTMDEDNFSSTSGKTEQFCKEEEGNESCNEFHGQGHKKMKAIDDSAEVEEKTNKKRRIASTNEQTVEYDGEEYDDNDNNEEEEDPNVRDIVLGLDALTNYCHDCVDLYNDGSKDDMSTTTLLNVQRDGTLKKIADIFVSFGRIRSSCLADAKKSKSNSSFHYLLEGAIETFGLQPSRQALFASLLLLLYLSSRVLSEDEESSVGGGGGDDESILSMLCDCLRFFVDVEDGLFYFYGPNNHRNNCMSNRNCPELISSVLTDPPIVTNLLKVLTLVSLLDKPSSSIGCRIQMESVSLILGCLHAIDMNTFVDRVALLQDKGEDEQSLVLLKQSIEHMTMNMNKTMCYPVMELGFLFLYALRRSILQRIKHYDESGEEQKQKNLVSFVEGIDDSIPHHICDLMTLLDPNMDSTCDQEQDDHSHITLDKRDPKFCAELCRKVLLTSSVANVSSFRCNGVYAPTVSSGDMGTRVADIPFIDVNAGDISFFAIAGEKRDCIMDKSSVSFVNSICSCRTLVRIKIDALKNLETKSSFGTSVTYNTEDCAVTIRLLLSDWSGSNLAKLLGMRAEDKARLSVSESVSIGSSSTCRRKEQELRESEHQTKILKIFIRRAEFKNFLSVLSKHNIPISNEDVLITAGDTSRERKTSGAIYALSAPDSKCTNAILENKRGTQNVTRNHVEFSTRFGLEDPRKIISLLNPNIPTECAETKKSLTGKDNQLKSSEFVVKDSAAPRHGTGASAISIESSTPATNNENERNSVMNLGEELNASMEDCTSYGKACSVAISTPDVKRKRRNTEDLDQSRGAHVDHCPPDTLRHPTNSSKDAVEVTPHPQVDIPQKNQVENQCKRVDDSIQGIDSNLILTRLRRYPSDYVDVPTSLGAISALCFASAKIQKSAVIDGEQQKVATTLPSSVDLFSNNVKNDDLVDAIFTLDDAFRRVAHEVTKLSASASNLVEKMKTVQKDQNEDLVNSLKWVNKIEKEFRDGAADWTSRRRNVDDQLTGLLMKALKK